MRFVSEKKVSPIPMKTLRVLTAAAAAVRAHAAKQGYSPTQLNTVVFDSSGGGGKT